MSNLNKRSTNDADHYTDYSQQNAYDKTHLIGKYAGTAKYCVIEDEEKIVLKRKISNILYWCIVYFTGFLFLFLLAHLYLRKLENLLWLYILLGGVLFAWYSWQCFPLFKGRKIVIWKKEKRVQVYKDGKIKKYPLDSVQASFQKTIKRLLVSWHYAFVFNSDVLFMVLKKRPEYDRVLEYLISIGYEEVNQRLEYRGGEKKNK